MNKLNATYSLLLLMLILNGLLLLKLFKPSDKKVPKFKSPHEILVSRLNFTENQKRNLDTVYIKRVEKLKHLEMVLKKYKNELFECSKSTKYDSLKVKQLATNIGYNMKEMDVKVFELLRGIRQICDPKQKQKFDEIFKEVFHKEAKKHTSVENNQS
jgi:Spy/CpxP family protein refolding chaperone